MGFLPEEKIICPYCGEPIVILIDPEDIDQEYIEDCQVCCKPISFAVSADDDGEPEVSVRGENEAAW
jgi:hypothetical protein